MIRLTACLLLTTAALAQHYGPSSTPSSLPMDYNDDIYDRNPRIQPSSNFFYNFHQARIDQPPHVEVREENLGKYLGRPRTTTAFIPHLNEEHVPDMNTVHLHRLADPNPASTIPPNVPLGPYNAHLPATIPPPPSTPKWMDLSDDSFRNHAQYKPNMYAYQPPTTPQPAYWSQQASVPTLNIDSRYSQSEPMDMGYSNFNSGQYYSSTTENTMGGNRYVRDPVGGRSRGNHKFSMSDLAVPSVPVLPVTTAPAPAAAQKGAPSSFPTLTPWSGDGFGK